MANKIVQLQNKAGDNLFPVAGSMKGDSITTAMIQDEAVTPAKIGFSTPLTGVTILYSSGYGSDITVSSDTTIVSTTITLPVKCKVTIVGNCSSTVTSGNSFIDIMADTTRLGRFGINSRSKMADSFAGEAVLDAGTHTLRMRGVLNNSSSTTVGGWPTPWLQWTAIPYSGS